MSTPEPNAKCSLKALLHQFTSEGQPGATMRSHCGAFLDALKLPEEIAGTEKVLAAILHLDLTPSPELYGVKIKNITLMVCPIYKGQQQPVGDRSS